MAADICHSHLLRDEFGHDFLISNKVDERDVRNLQYQAACEGCQLAPLHVVAYHLRHTEQSSFERCRAAGDKGCRAVLQEAVRLVANNLYIKT